MKTALQNFCLCGLAFAALNASAAATNSPATDPLARPANDPGAPLNMESYSPDTLPGNGLSQHPFLYAGQYDFRKPVQTIFIVRDGKIVWTYDDPGAPLNLESYSPATLPGNGLSQHPFLYAGQYDFRKPVQTIFIVRDGKIVWTYEIPTYASDAAKTLQEISDATLLSNGNVVFAHKTGAGVVTQDKKLIWNYDAPPGCEVHVCKPVGLDRVMIVQNGRPAKLMIINIVTGKTEKEFELPTDPKGAVHTQFRRAHMTLAGTFLVAHHDQDKVVEYDAERKRNLVGRRADSVGRRAAPQRKHLDQQPRRLCARGQSQGRDGLGVHAKGRARHRAVDIAGGEPARKRQHAHQQLVSRRRRGREGREGDREMAEHRAIA